MYNGVFKIQLFHGCYKHISMNQRHRTSETSCNIQFILILRIEWNLQQQNGSIQSMKSLKLQNTVPRPQITAIQQ